MDKDKQDQHCELVCKNCGTVLIRLFGPQTQKITFGEVRSVACRKCDLEVLESHEFLKSNGLIEND